MTTTNNQPSHILFHIKASDKIDPDTGYAKGYWTRIGAAWPTRDGRLNIVQDYMPQTAGQLQLVPVELLNTGQE